MLRHPYREERRFTKHVFSVTDFRMRAYTMTYLLTAFLANDSHDHLNTSRIPSSASYSDSASASIVTTAEIYTISTTSSPATLAHSCRLAPYILKLLSFSLSVDAVPSIQYLHNSQCTSITNGKNAADKASHRVTNLDYCCKSEWSDSSNSS